jgi:hypothetical protein
MAPSVPRHNGQVLKEIMSKDIHHKLRMTKKSAPGPDDVTKNMVLCIRAYSDVLAMVINLEKLKVVGSSTKPH